jgi:hypothetical protein
VYKGKPKQIRYATDPASGAANDIDKVLTIPEYNDEIEFESS